jgi:hypothetical protein
MKPSILSKQEGFNFYRNEKMQDAIVSEAFPPSIPTAETMTMAFPPALSLSLSTPCMASTHLILPTLLARGRGGGGK